MPELRLALLGRFELSGENGPIDLTSKKLVGLVAYLACTFPEPQSREKLMALLWGSRFEIQAQQSLRQALTRLRRLLGPIAIVSNGETVTLRPDALICDVIRFETLIRQDSREALVEAVDLYRDRLLADIAIPEEAWTEWLDVERQRLEGLALDTMMKLGEWDLHLGDFDSALRSGQRATAVNNLREDAHRLIMRALASGGRRVEALKHYDDLTVLLKRELDVLPDSTTRSLVEEIRRDSGRQQPSTGGLALDAPATQESMQHRPSFALQGRSKTQSIAAAPLAFLRVAFGFGAGSTPSRAAFAASRATSSPRLRGAVVAAAVMFFLGVAGAVTWIQLRSGGPEAASLERIAFPLPQKPSIAVLPFENLSDAGQDLISEGLTENLINVLARNPLLFVIAHSSTSTYEDQSDAAKRATEELGVRYIVEGSVKRAGDRVRVTIQLVDALGGRVMWSERYERAADDLLALEDDITASIARSLDVRITYGTDQSFGGTRRLDAWTAYLEGRSEYLKFSEAGNSRAREHYLHALEIDPKYAEAMVALAHTYLIEMAGAPKENWAGALASIAQLESQAALIAPRMPRLHQLRSMVAMTRGDHASALAEAETMVELDPNSAESHFALGRMYLFTAQYDRAIDSFGTAQRIDPHSRGSYSSHSALAQLALGKTDLAVSNLETVIERWPDYSPAREFLAIAYQLAGRHADARQQVALNPNASMLAIERFFTAMEDAGFASRVIVAARQAGIPD